MDNQKLDCRIASGTIPFICEVVHSGKNIYLRSYMEVLYFED